MSSSNRPSKLDLASVPSEPKPSVASKPTAVTFVVSGSVGVPAIDALTVQWKESGFLQDKDVQLRGLVYELGASEVVGGTTDKFAAAREAPNNLSVTLIQPLAGKPSGGKPAELPAPQAPAHESMTFSLPTITSADDLKDSEAWLELLRTASQRRLGLELAIRAPTKADDADLESIRESVEEILSKAHSEEAEEMKKLEDSQQISLGSIIILDSFGSPPTHLSSSQLARSKELSDWTAFVGRLALHPRTYLKLSPLSLSTLLPTSSTPPRTADYSSSTVQSATSTLSNIASGIESTVQTVLGSSSAQDRRAELGRRLQIYLDVLIEAFGVERVFFSLSFSSSERYSSNKVEEGLGITKEEKTFLEDRTKEWFELLSEALKGMGLGQEAVDNIFSNNATKVYRI